MPAKPSKDVTDTYQSIYSEIATIDMKWQINQRIFSKQNIPLLRKADSACFVYIRESIVRDIAMSICRLTDPELQGKGQIHSNMTLSRFIRLAKVDGLKGIGGLEAKYGHILAHTAIKRLRGIRNKRLGHLDAATALANSASNFPTAGYGPKDIRAATGLLNDWVNKAASVVGRKSRRLGPDSGDPNIGYGLINALQYGVVLES